MKQKVTTLFTIIMLAPWACSQDANVYDCEEGRKEVACSELTPREQAMVSLKEREYAKAVEIYTSIIEDDPEDYQAFMLLAASYAGKAGFRILEIANAQFAGEGGLIEIMGQFLPSPDDFETTEAYELAVDDMNLSVERLQLIPEALRASTSEEDFAPSAVFQLTVYQSAYSIMLMNKFALNAQGQFDESQLDDMTEEDAVEILNSLRDAAAAGGEDSAELAAAIDAALLDIDDQEGASNNDKLKEFLKKEQSE